MSHWNSAVELASAIKSKSISPVEVAKHYLEQIDLKNGELNAFIWRNDDQVLAQAKEQEESVMGGEPLGPFHGVPIPIKDLTEVNGQPVTLGSRATGHKTGVTDSSAVTLMRKAGFNLMGRTNSPEFGTLPVTENLKYGPTKNPFDPSRTPGGSSGGAAAAVASGMAPIAHASDGGGSIRIPAACCGLVGLKPSRGRIPKGPLITDVFHGFSTDGCVSKTVADTAAFLDALAYSDPTAWYSAPKFDGSYLETSRKKPAKLRIAYSPKGSIDTHMDSECIEGLEKTANLLRELGHDVFEGTPPWSAIPDLAKHFINIWVTMSAYIPIPSWEQAEPLNQGLRELGLAQSSISYVESVMKLQAFSRIVSHTFINDFDVFLTPTLAIEPPKIGWLFETGLSDPLEILWRCTQMVPSTGWVNATGQPAISLPLHKNKNGLPIGMQLVGAPFREDLLLQLASQIEEARPWTDEYLYSSSIM
jgi:amidase